MAYTDLWRCKHCEVLPDIQMMGKHFRIACDHCGDRSPEVEAESLDEVVSRWNRLHAPPKPTGRLLGKLREWIQLLKNSAAYFLGRYHENHERSAHLKRAVMRARTSHPTKS
jgi:hypothetical protein